MRAAGRGRLAHLRLASSPASGSGAGDDRQERCRSIAGAPALGAPIRIGVDLVLVSEVASALERYGERYARRLFTAGEIECCRTAEGLSAERLAARFAAKEAAIKALEPVDGEGLVPDFTEIEVRRRPGGACELVLRGTAAALSARRGLGGLAVSVVHEGGYAAAVVVGWSGRTRSECASSGNEGVSGMHEQAGLAAQAIRKEH